MPDNAPTAETLIAAELERPVAGEVQALADAIRERHGESVLAILYYGACRRTGEVADRVVDLYAVAGRYRDFHGNPLAAAANAALPPNVYYLEVEHGGAVVRAKYAVVSLAGFARAVSARAGQPYFWGRFAQPVVLVQARDGGVRGRLAAALGEAARTLLTATLPLMPERFTARDLWTRALDESYATELRAEQPGRSDALYRADAAFYEGLAAAILTQGGGAEADGGAGYRHDATGARRARAAWWRRRRLGKLLSVLRLAKASFTFAGGTDYILWKVGEHSGVRLEASPWQRRHPLLSAPVLYWKLYRRGGFR